MKVCVHCITKEGLVTFMNTIILINALNLLSVQSFKTFVFTLALDATSIGTHLNVYYY